MTSIIPGLFGLDSATAFRTLQKDPQKYIDNFTKANKQLQTDTDYFNKVVTKFTSVDDLFKDQRALKYVLESYGLGTETNSAGLMKKVLSEDPTATNSLSSQLSDTRYATMAKALRLDQGMTTLQGLATSGALKTNYIQNEFEETLGDQDTALRQAAYFARTAPTGISSVYSVLGDKILRSVVTETLDIPQEIAIQSVESQAAVVAKKVDVTKFSSAATTNTTVTAAQLARAKSDHTLIQTNLAISDAALKQVNSIKDTISQLATNYNNLSTVTDPSGANADTIAVQQNAVPQLVRYDELTSAGNLAITSVSDSITSLKNLITQAQTAGSDLSSLKTQFSSIVDAINVKINGATITAPDGSSENILLNGSADTLSTTYDASGSSVTINRYDVTNIQDLLSQANDAFNAATDNTDGSNLNTALSRLLRGQDATDLVSTQLDTDTTALGTAATSGFFAATLNSSQLVQGKLSVDDSLSRITQIEDVLTKIGTLATQAASLADDADHTDVETQFTTYKAQLHSLIENTGTAGLDNFLNNAPDQNYEIVNGQSIHVKGGFDLETQIASVIDAGSVSDAASANALYTSSIQVTNNTDRAKNSLETSQPILTNTVSFYDPRGKLDTQVYDLQSQLGSLISAGADTTTGTNLLSATQKTIQLSGLSTGTSLSFRSVSSLQSDLASSLSSVIAQLGNSDPSTIVDALDDATAVVNTASHTLTSDNRVATITDGQLAATIDALDSSNTTPSSTLYQTNAFTQKFLNRYLALNGSDGTTGTSSTSYLSALFTSSSDSSSAMTSIFSLISQMKA